MFPAPMSAMSLRALTRAVAFLVLALTACEAADSADAESASPTTGVEFETTLAPFEGFAHSTGDVPKAGPALA